MQRQAHLPAGRKLAACVAADCIAGVGCTAVAAGCIAVFLDIFDSRHRPRVVARTSLQNLIHWNNAGLALGCFGILA